jgi:hypothetical protein
LAIISVPQYSLKNLGVPWPVEQRLVDVPVVGADRLLVPDAACVLPDGGCAVEEDAQRLLALPNYYIIIKYIIMYTILEITKYKITG